MSLTGNDQSSPWCSLTQHPPTLHTTPGAIFCSLLHDYFFFFNILLDEKKNVKQVTYFAAAGKDTVNNPFLPLFNSIHESQQQSGKPCNYPS